MDDLSCIRFRKLKKNKSDEDPKVLRKALLNSKQSLSSHYQDEREPNKNRQSYPGTLRSFPHPHNTTLSTSVKSLPSSPPSHVPFHNRLLGDWCRSKRLEEILPLFPSEMSLYEFSHLSPRMRQVSLGSPGRLVSLPPCDYSNGNTPMVITLRGGLAHSQVVVRDPRLKEKVVVAINAARAARRQAEEAEHGTPCGSPITLSPNRRSLDVDALGLFHHSRLGSSTGRLSRELSVISTLSTRSLNALGRVSQEDLRRTKLVGGMAVSSGNLQFSGITFFLFLFER